MASSDGKDPALALEDARARMRWIEEPGRFALIGFDAPPGPADLDELALAGPAACVREGGETTLLVRREAAEAIAARHAGARVEAPLVWFRFETPMAWELVGFLALVTGRMAEARVPLGAVCGYSRDHLFVAEAHRERARVVLAELFGEASR